MNPLLIPAILVILIIFKVLGSRGSLKKEEVKAILDKGGKIIDVRTPMEYKSGHINGAINIEYTNIAKGIKKAKISKETPVILYCASGSRSNVAVSELKNKGFSQVYNGGSHSSLSRVIG